LYLDLQHGLKGHVWKNPSGFFLREFSFTHDQI